MRERILNLTSLLPSTEVLDKDAKFLFIGRATSGLCNRMVAFASAIALSVLTQRVPIMVNTWNDQFVSRFGGPGTLPPAGILTMTDPRHRTMVINSLGIKPDDPAVQGKPQGKHGQRSGWGIGDPCVLGLIANRRDDFCYRGLYEQAFSNVSQHNSTTTAGKSLILAPSCRVLHVESNQYYIPMLLPFSLRGSPLRKWLDAKQPFVSIARTVFRPRDELKDSVAAFFEYSIGTRKQQHESKNKADILTIHMRTEMESWPGIEGFLDCAVKAIAERTIGIVYVASDDDATRSRVTKVLSDLKSISSGALILTFSDYEVFLKSSTNTTIRSNFGRSPNLAESLLIGKGSVCVLTADSTFSQIATTWWGGEHCETVLFPEKKTCSAPKPSDVTIRGLRLSSLLGCDGFGCPQVPFTNSSVLSSACQGKRRVSSLCCKVDFGAVSTKSGSDSGPMITSLPNNRDNKSLQTKDVFLNIQTQPPGNHTIQTIQTRPVLARRRKYKTSLRHHRHRPRFP
mmetsp:Transcript_30870/g.69347  ORF Transcript_30870/g.69347 Transcript_30870/m.69347 type:complete len:512 (+) Transcript_30870:174-1709(+)